MKAFPKHPFLITAIVLGSLLLAACNLPQATPQPGGNLQTAVAATLTAAAPPPAASPLPPTAAAPTATQQPPPTSTPTPTVIPPTVTPSVPTVSVTVNTNCRTGPGKVYPRVGVLLVGQSARAVARDPSGDYLYIANPARAGEFCWVWGRYARVAGPQVPLPVFTPIPLPADATVEFAGAVQCMDGVHVAVKITNTGGVTWQSFTASYLDLTAPNGFDQFQKPKFYDSAGCGGQQVIDDLTAGESGYAQWTLTGSLIAPGHRIRVTLHLFDTDAPGGSEITRTVEFTFPTP